MMLHRMPISSARLSRRALVCKASKNSDVKLPFAAVPRVAAAVAAASLLLLGSSPVLPADAQTYEEELQSLIEQRRGSAFKPELSVSPGEEERQRIAERQLIEQAIAKDTVPLVEAAQADESAIKAQALEESAAAQLATSGAVVKPGAANATKPGTSATYGTTDAGPVASNLTGLLVGGGLLTVAAAAAALSNNNAAGGTETTAAAPAPPAATPSDAAPSSSSSGTQAGPTSSA